VVKESLIVTMQPMVGKTKTRSGRSTAPGLADRDLRRALLGVNALSEKLSIPGSVAAEAASICRRALEEGLARGRPLAQIAASSLYAACREMNIPTTLDDVAAASGVGRKAVARWYRLLVITLDLKIPVGDPAECLAKVASRAKADPKVEADALEIISRAEKTGITDGLHPTGLAASALYLASMLNGQWLTQSSAAEAAGVREATVRKECKRLRKVVEVRLGRTTRKKRISLSELSC
jgi:transcription initiation factor TFIIB